MTDNEIVKAWQKILSMGDVPIGEHWSVGVVTTKLAKETLDMLNRQKADLEKAIKTIDGLMAGQKKLIKEAKTAKLSAIKKYENRLIDTAVGNWTDKVDVSTISDVASELVKEMVGDENG